MLVAVGLANGLAVGVALGVGLAVGEAVAEALALALALAVDEAVALGEGEGDGVGLGDGEGLGVGEGDGVGVATGEGLGEGVWPAGVGVAARPCSPTMICPRPVASKWTVVTSFFIAETELVRIWRASVSGADDPQPATSGATTNRPPSATKRWVRRNTRILLTLYRSETLSPKRDSRTPSALKDRSSEARRLTPRSPGRSGPRLLPNADAGAFCRCDLVYFVRSLTRKKYSAPSIELSVATQPLLSHEKPFAPAE